MRYTCCHVISDCHQHKILLFVFYIMTLYLALSLQLSFICFSNRNDGTNIPRLVFKSSVNTNISESNDTFTVTLEQIDREVGASILCRMEEDCKHCQFVWNKTSPSMSALQCTHTVKSDQMYPTHHYNCILSNGTVCQQDYQSG